MPRRIDLTQLPPEQADCYACGRSVTLDRRARHAGKFRCPFCHSDNRVSPDGRTYPVAGLAEPVELMPQVRCVACGQTNRLPRRLLRGSGYTCWSCGAVGIVPQTLRRRAGLTSRRVLTGAGIAFLLILTWSAFRISTALARYGSPWENPAHAGVLDQRDNFALLGEPSASSSAAGRRYEVSVEVHNSLRQPVTYHFAVRILDDDELVVSRNVSALRLAPGETRRVDVVLVDPRRRPANAVRIDPIGIS